MMRAIRSAQAAQRLVGCRGRPRRRADVSAGLGWARDVHVCVNPHLTVTNRCAASAGARDRCHARIIPVARGSSRPETRPRAGQGSTSTATATPLVALERAQSAARDSRSDVGARGALTSTCQRHDALEPRERRRARAREAPTRPGARSRPRLATAVACSATRGCLSAPDQDVGERAERRVAECAPLGLLGPVEERRVVLAAAPIAGWSGQ